MPTFQEVITSALYVQPWQASVKEGDNGVMAGLNIAWRQAPSQGQLGQSDCMGSLRRKQVKEVIYKE